MFYELSVTAQKRKSGKYKGPARDKLAEKIIWARPLFSVQQNQNRLAIIWASKFSRGALDPLQPPNRSLLNTWAWFET